MTDKELKKMNRTELADMLISISKENEGLKEQIEDLKKQLESRKLSISKAGSIAEACLQINGIFEAAQASAEQYLENIRNQESLCDAMKREAASEAERILDDAQAKAESMMAEAEAKASSYWDGVSQKLSQFYSEHQGLREMLKVIDENK